MSKFELVHELTALLANSTYEQRERMFADMDKVMNPILNAARSTADEEQIETWLQALPLGYYRQTLRVIIFERFHQPVVEAVIAATPEPASLLVAGGGYAAAINAAIAEGI